jgi:hypothetical protein
MPNHKRSRLSRIKQFVSFIDERGWDDCWPWLGELDSDGYGVFQSTCFRSMKAHRIALEIHLNQNLPSPGRDLKGSNLVLHSCDSRSCCNPKHLFLGSQADNIADRDKKGRVNRGENRPAAKLNVEQVKEIRRKYYPYKYSLAKLAKEYEVDLSTVHAVVTRKGWKHVE